MARLLTASAHGGAERVLPFWADGGKPGERAGAGGLAPGRHVIAAMPMAVRRANLGELIDGGGLEGWLGAALATPGASLHVVGLTYEAGYAGETLVGGLTRPPFEVDDQMVAVVASYPGHLVAEGELGPWEAVGDIDALAAALEHPAANIGAPPALHLEDPRGYEPYRRAVETVLDGIAAGDFYQVNLSRELRAECPDEAGPALFMAMREAQPAAFSALWSLGRDGWLVSGSPECLLAWDGATREAHTFPIKGTIARGHGHAEDAALAARLMASEKDRAEHVMIVDLARNDLGRLAEMGRVEVHELYGQLRLRTLRHLVSDVGAVVRDGVGLAEVVGALFPGGSITGAPKIAAMNAIARLEGGPRGFYCGSLGVVFGGERPQEARFSILIRTAVVGHGRLVYRTGGGIVADSEPLDEWRETELKAKALEDALNRWRPR